MGKFSTAAFVLALAATAAMAQDLGTVEDVPPAPLPNAGDPKIPAKEIFGRKRTPTPAPATVIGFYAKGCLAGGVELPINGPHWQVMRLSRHRNWGHPAIIAFLERLSANAAKVGWPGILIGDMSQPRGGPMITGHASHQVGLDADIWLTPMPNRELTRREREETSATMIVADDRLDVDPKVWHGQFALIREAARDPNVQRIFVNAAIKKAMCREAGTDRSWLHKLRPYWGHDYHFHVRLYCPSDSPDCKPQPDQADDDGCGKELDGWFKESILHPKPSPTPPKPRPPLKLADLPPACRAVVLAP